MSHTMCYRVLMAWPTTQNPRASFVTLRLTDDEVLDLDVLVASRGTSRSAVVRDALREAVLRDKASRQKGVTLEDE